MKVFLEPSTNSRGIQRVRKALVDYLPEGVKIVPTIEECDFAILHIYGRHTTMMHKIGWLKSQGKGYAMIQYCIRSTMKPETKSWLTMWDGAKVVWSYYDIPQLMLDDITQGNRHLTAGMEKQTIANFYHAPLGVDSKVFRDVFIERGFRILESKKGDKAAHRHYVIIASAQHALSESVRECAFAAKAVDRQMFHVGHELRRGDDIVCQANLTDEELAEKYSESDFVSGLRRDEGFELPVIEGLLCGARPIVFDRPEMRHWFGDFAVFIEEGTREEVIESLKNVFEKGAEPVTSEEKELVAKKFDWQPIISGFWERILA